MNSWSHILVCRDSFQRSCMRTVARSSTSAHGSGRDLSFWTLCLKTFHLGTVCVCLAWPSWILDIYCIFYRETGNWKFTRSEIRVFRIRGEGGNGSVSFTMSSGGQDGFSFIPRWNEEAATLESFDQRVKLFVSSTKKEERYLCGPRLLATFDPQGDTFRYVRDNLTDVQLAAADGSGALMIVKTIRLSVGPKSIQEGVRLLLDFFRLDSLRRQHGETMRHWTRRFTLQYSKVGQALDASNAQINKDFLHGNIRGILLAETSGLTSSEFASVLATSGTTGAEGESIGNSWKFSHLVEAFCTQWGDAALTARDAKARKSEAFVAAVDNFDRSELSEAAARIDKAISWNDTDPQIVEYEDDDDDNYEEDVDLYAGDCDDELDDNAYTAGTPTDDPELLEQFDGNLEDADASASQVYASASRSFQEARELWLVSRVPQAIFLLLAVLLMAWLSHPLIDNL